MSDAARIAHALTAAAEWRLLGLLLERPRAGWLEEVRALAAEVRDDALRTAVERAADTSEGQYLALLGPGGVASPREAAYVGLRDPSWMMADLVRCYEAFGFAPRREDPLDHVAVEAGFVGYLHLKEAYALERGDGEAATLTAATRSRFIAEHLAPIARPLAERLAAAATTGVGEAVAALVARVPPPPAGARPAPDDDDPTAACGACMGEWAPRGPTEG